MDTKDITWMVIMIAWICFIIYAVLRYRFYKQLEKGPLKKLTGEVLLVQVWIIMIFMMMASEKMIITIARY